MRSAEVLGLLFSVVLCTVTATVVAGCATAPKQPAYVPQRPGPIEKVHDYSQQPADQDMGEAERIELLREVYGDLDMSNFVAPAPQSAENAQNRDEEWEQREVLEDRRNHHSQTSYPTKPYRRHRGHFPIGNTLFFGTVGGIIGHQSGHRDQGILIGAGYGLLRDLLRSGY